VTALALGLAVAKSGLFLVRTGHPSSDVLAAVEARFPTIEVNNFAPGDVRGLLLDRLPIIVWRRDEADMILAASQDVPEDWAVKYSDVMGRDEPVYAADKNLTLNGEWFFALAHIVDSPGWIPALRTGDFDGFFGMKHAGH